MAVHHLTYLDLTLEQRKAAANRVREQVRAALINPFLAPDQTAILKYQLERITKWEHGKLQIGTPFAMPGLPKAE